MSNREKIKEVETVIDALREDIRYAELQLEELRGPAVNYGQVWRDSEGENFLVSAADFQPTGDGMLYQLVSLEYGARWAPPQKDPFNGRRDEFTYVGRADRVVQVNK